MANEGSYRSAGTMVLPAMTASRSLTFLKGLLIWACAFSLLIVLANRVPYFSANETSWVGSAPVQLSAKLLVKDLFLLHPPATGMFTVLRSISIRTARKEARPPVSVFLGNCVYIRPPPTA